VVASWCVRRTQPLVVIVWRAVCPMVSSIVCLISCLPLISTLDWSDEKACSSSLFRDRPAFIYLSYLMDSPSLVWLVIFHAFLNNLTAQRGGIDCSPFSGTSRSRPRRRGRNQQPREDVLLRRRLPAAGVAPGPALRAARRPRLLGRRHHLDRRVGALDFLSSPFQWSSSSAFRFSAVSHHHVC
jgi:hypothetical protein